MNARSFYYWMTTTLIALSFLTGGAANLYHVDETVRGMVSLGYPVYFVTIIGAWKVLGGFAILAPRLPRLKEWAYAGIAFDLTGATFSHIAMGHPAVKAIVPLALLVIAGASWALRPARRTLGPATREPAAARSGVHGIHLSPFVNAQGRARNAMEFYHKVLDVDLDLQTLNEQGRPRVRS